MRWKGPIKQQNIRLPEDMHEEVILEARKRRKITAETAYQQGMTAWLDGDSVVPTPFGALNQTEEEFLCGMLLYLRDQTVSTVLDRRLVRDTVKAIAMEYFKNR